MQTMAVAPQAPVRVRALKGFYAVVQGQFGQVNPGDVIDLDRGIARDLANKLQPVAPNEPLVRQKDYLPERKRNPKPDQVSELAALRAAVDALTKVVTALVERESAPPVSTKKT